MTDNTQKVPAEAEPQPQDSTNREWTAIRDECVSGGELTDLCNLVAAAHGYKLDVVKKYLSCGCILVPSDLDEFLL